MPVIQINNLIVHRRDTAICTVPTLQIEAGEHVGVGGDNGSGKSTLLRVIAGLERGHAGTCKVKLGRRDRVFVAQNPILFRGSVLSNVMYGLRSRGGSPRSARQEAARWLDTFGIGALASAASFRLSGGERRRTALARAMAIQPKLLLLDEPLSDLDDDGRQRLNQVLSEVRDTTVVITSPAAMPDGFVTRRLHLE